MLQITMSEDNARLIAEALELQSRLLCGQLKELDKLLYHKDLNQDASEYALRQLKILYHPKLTENEYYGIYSKQAEGKARDCYDLQKNILYHFNKDNKYISVHSTPHLLCKEENKIIIKEID